MQCKSKHSERQRRQAAHAVGAISRHIWCALLIHGTEEVVVALSCFCSEMKGGKVPGASKQATSQAWCGCLPPSAPPASASPELRGKGAIRPLRSLAPLAPRVCLARPPGLHSRWRSCCQPAVSLPPVNVAGERTEEGSPHRRGGWKLARDHGSLRGSLHLHGY